MAESNGFQVLLPIVERMKSQSNEAARRELEAVLECGSDLKTLIFASALAMRVGGASRERANLYLRDYAQPQIDLFDLMATKVPLVGTAGTIANEMLCRAMRGRDEIRLLEIGIGSGQQIIALLARMRMQGIRPSRMTVIGVEPMQDVLNRARISIMGKAAEQGISIEFVSIARCAEELSDQDWARIRDLPGDLIVNEAFAAHHIPGPRERRDDLKDRFLARVRALRPVAFVLTEPHSDHQTPDLVERFTNAWKHFGLAFDVIDRLDIQSAAKDALKLHFFAREIEDTMLAEESERSERHERADMWLERLQRAGFSPVQQDLSFIHELHPRVITLSANDGYVGLDFGTETIVAVMCAA